MRLDAASARATRSGPPNSAGTARTNKAWLCRLRRPRGQILVALATCALIWACTSSQGTSAHGLTESAAQALAAPGDLFGWSGTTVGAARTVIQLGHSVKGLPLAMKVFGSGADRVLVVGGIHGNEPTGAAVADDLARFLETHPESVEGRTVAIFGAVNPDGLLSGQRTNANGVDLNRNFPSTDWRRANPDELSHGRFPASEPETVALMRAVEVIKPHRIIDIHSIMRGYHGNNYDGLARKLAQLMSQSNGYPVLADVGYPTPGALSSWAGIDRGIPTITLELPGDLDRTQCWRENGAAVLAFIHADLDSLGR